MRTNRCCKPGMGRSASMLAALFMAVTATLLRNAARGSASSITQVSARYARLRVAADPGGGHHHRDLVVRQRQPPIGRADAPSTDCGTKVGPGIRRF